VNRPVPIQQPATLTTYRPLDPNYKLDLCCRKQQLGAVCQQMCNFDTFTDRSVGFLNVFENFLECEEFFSGK
jgi:hypothetical protein